MAKKCSTQQPCFLLIPGLLCSADLFSEQTSLLWQYGSVMVINHTQCDNIKQFVEDVLEIAPPEFIPVGLSMGGYIALELWRQAPERVQGLVLMDTSARPDMPEATQGRMAKIEQANEEGLRSIAEEMYPNLVTASLISNHKMFEVYQKMAFSTGVKGYENQQKMIMSRPDYRPLLKDIAAPTLVLIGEHDKTIPLEHSQELVDGISDATLEIIPISGHLTALENPLAVNNVLKKWLDRLNLK